MRLLLISLMSFFISADDHDEPSFSGLSQSKSSGKWKKYSKGEYWFEPSDWVHGGDDDTPNLGNQCTDLLVIRVVEEGKDHTVFVD